GDRLGGAASRQRSGGLRPGAPRAARRPGHGARQGAEEETRGTLPDRRRIRGRSFALAVGASGPGAAGFVRLSHAQVRAQERGGRRRGGRRVRGADGGRGGGPLAGGGGAGGGGRRPGGGGGRGLAPGAGPVPPNARR